MTKLHERTFGCSAEDSERDALLAARCAALQFVSPAHLEIAPGLANDASLSLAVKELHKLDAYKAPRDKLVCVLNCCRVLNNLLLAHHHAASSSPAGGEGGGGSGIKDGFGADDFTPLLIYATIKARLPALGSNLGYVERYRMAGKLRGEAHYYFVQLVSDFFFRGALFF